MNKVFLSLGSNIDPKKNIPLCIEKLKTVFKNVHTSSCYETDPIGPAGQDHFWNAAAVITTDKNRESLSVEIRKLEENLGRKRDSNNKFAPRPIDIDILPQEGYQKQGFIIIPLAELSPETLDPETQQTFKALSDQLSDSEKKLCRRIIR